MKSKKLIVFICVLAFLTVLIVLNSTVFTLQHASINWMSTKHTLENVEDSEILKNIETGGSIFLLNKIDISKKLEKDNPYLRVVGIETKFPNKIVVHSAERETMYAVELAHDEFAIIDELGKVLDLSDSTVFAGNSLGAKPIKVKFTNSTINPENFAQGEDMKDEGLKNLLVQLSTTLRESRYEPTASKGVFTAFNIELTGTGYQVNMSTRNGMVITLEDAYNHTTDKFLRGLRLYNIKLQESVVKGTIVVKFNQVLNESVARYVKPGEQL